MPLSLESQLKRWKVTRVCCRSGNCGDCRASFVKANRKRVLHADNLTEATARAMATNWSEYEAVAAPMEGRPARVPTLGVWSPKTPAV